MTDHEHAFVLIRDDQRAPAGEPPAHTHVKVLVCECGYVEVFPRDNYALTTAAYRAQLRAFVEGFGLRLDPELPA